MEPIDDPDGPDLVIGQRYGGSTEDLVRARLISQKSGDVYDLTWGWNELAYVIPWDHFPMGEDVYQIVPVPCGEYELILRGSGIQGLRQTITLRPSEITELKLTPVESTSDVSTKIASCSVTLTSIHRVRHSIDLTRELEFLQHARPASQGWSIARYSALTGG